MFLKEWRDARWKLFVGAVLVLATGLTIPFGVGPIAWSAPAGVPSFPMMSTREGQFLVWSEWFGTGLGNPILFFLAVVLGAGLISGETSRGTIFLLLSKPVGRTRVLLTKYAVGAGVLFVVVLLFSAALLVAASVLGDPPSVGGLIISTVLMWLGLLFVLGIALTLSVVLDNTLLAAAGTVLVWMLTTVPTLVVQQLIHLEAAMKARANPGVVFTRVDSTINPELQEILALPLYWSNTAAYFDASFPDINFLVCLAAAALPLLAALWLFRRKAY